MDDFTDEELTVLAKEAVNIAIRKKELRKEPIAIYDGEKEEAVLVYPDGRREAEKRLRKGSYSERIRKET